MKTLQEKIKEQTKRYLDQNQAEISGKVPTPKCHCGAESTHYNMLPTGRNLYRCAKHAINQTSWGCDPHRYDFSPIKKKSA